MAGSALNPRKRISVRQFLRSSRHSAILCGRVLSIDGKNGMLVLKDASGEIPVKLDDRKLPSFRTGDILCAAVFKEDGTLRLAHCEVLVHTQYDWEKQLPGQAGELLRNGHRFELLKLRSAFLQAIRRFFVERGFIELDVPTLVVSTGMEPHIEPFFTELQSREGRRKRVVLHTSPELALKKMLVAGYERVFYLGHVFRNEEFSPLHQPEFTMLEWYRAFEDYTALMSDCQDLFRYLQEQLAPHWAELWRKDDFLLREWEMVDLPEAFQQRFGVDLADISENQKNVLVDLARKCGISEVDESWEIDDLFFLLFMKEMEPFLGQSAPAIVKDYPVWIASLARRKKGVPNLVERFEVYAGGLELANAFTELNDPSEQRVRMLADWQKRQRLGKSRLVLDEEFLEALRIGMPPCAGIALGMDRLLMLCSGSRMITDVIPFNMETLLTHPPNLT